MFSVSLSGTLTGGLEGLEPPNIVIKAPQALPSEPQQLFSLCPVE